MRKGTAWSGVVLLGLAAAGLLVWSRGIETPGPPNPPPAGAAKPIAATPPPAPTPAPAPPVEPRGPGVLTGRLVRGCPARPLPGRVVVAGPGLPPLSAEVGDTGLFSLEGLPVGTDLELEARSPGLLPVRLPGIRISLSCRFDVGDIRLGPGSRMALEVVDTRDRPVAGATAALYGTPLIDDEGDRVAWAAREEIAGGPIAKAVTDAKGTTTVEGIPPGEWRLVVSAPGFAARHQWYEAAEGLASGPLRVVLLPAVSLRGRVLAADGPVAGAVVIAASADYDRRLRSDPTDASGAYALSGLEPGSWSLGVLPRPDLFVDAGRLVLPGQERFDIRLATGGRIRGTVLDAAIGEPVAGALVGAGIGGEKLLHHYARTVTGKDGAFDLDGLPPGTLSEADFTVVARDYLPFPDGRAGIVVPAGEIVPGSVLEATIRLRRGGSVAGTVRDGAGRPVAGARVTLFHSIPGKEGGYGQGSETRPVVSGADGSYRIPLAEEGKGLLRVELEGFCQPGCPGDPGKAFARNEPPESCTVEVPATGEVRKDLVLSKGGTVEGTVTDAAGAPVAGAFVDCTKEEEYRSRGAAAPTDRQGRFRIEGVDPGEDLVVSARVPEGSKGASPPLTVGEGETVRDVRVALEAAGGIAGTLRREDGGPLRAPRLQVVRNVRGMEVGTIWDNDLWAAPLRAVKPDGSFRIAGLAAGTWTVVAGDDGCASAPGPNVSVAPGDVKEGLEVVLHPELAIAGRVVDEGGKGIPDASLLVQRKETENSADALLAGLYAPVQTVATDPGGAFRQGGLLPGSYTVTVRVQGGKERSVTAEAGASDLVITVARGFTIAGRAVDEATGEGVGGISVTGSPTGNHDAAMKWEVLTAADGSFLLEALPAGPVYLRFETPMGTKVGGYGSKSVPGVAAGTTGLRVTLVKGLEVAGRVVDEDGKPVTVDFHIQVMGKDDAGEVQFAVFNQPANGPGTFRIGGLPPGAYWLTVMQFSEYLTTDVKDVRSGTVDLVVVLRRGGRIAGRVLGEDGKPVGAGVRVKATAVSAPKDPVEAEGSEGSARTEEDGTFEIRPLGEFRFRVVAGGKGSDYLATTLPDEVAPGAKGLEIRLVRGAVLSGVLVDAAGKVPSQAEVKASLGEFASDWVDVAADGTFEIRGLPAGSAMIQARLARGPPIDVGSWLVPQAGVRLVLPAK